MYYRSAVANLMRDLPRLNPEILMERVFDLEAKGATIHFLEYVKINEQLYGVERPQAMEITIRELTESALATAH